MRYFTVTAKCGHVGKGCYIPITFAVKASSAAEAASVTRSLPRVKHHHKDAILSVVEVDLNEFEDRYYVNSFDPYLQCTSKKEQMQMFDAISSRIQREATTALRSKKTMHDKPVYDGKKRIRNIRQFAREQAAAYAMAEVM